MSRRNIFVEVSGDEFYRLAFLNWIKELVKRAWTVICVGGGTQVNEEFLRLGFPLKEHGPLGRELRTFEERQTQRDVIEKNQAKLQDFLVENGVYAAIEIPFFTIGTVLCPQNGDQMIRSAYLGFDELYRVTTTISRAKQKVAMYKDLPKVKVFYENESVLMEYVEIKTP